MRFRELELAGAHLIELDLLADERGYFARAFCRETFESLGLEGEFVQANQSHSVKAGTLRGMHYQLPPADEVKLVQCVKGAVLDVIVDLRPASATYRRWVAEELSEENHRMMYVPRGFAHGYLTLRDDCLVTYLVSAVYSPSLERGVRWDDPAFGIEWPISDPILSPRDRCHPDYRLGEDE